MAVDYTFEDTWTQPGNNAIDGRYHDGAFLAVGANAVNPLSSYRDGVLPSAYGGGLYLDLMIVPDSPTPGMAVRSYLGQCVISRSGQGPYVSTLRSTGRIDLPASSTTNPRRDLIVAQVLDASIGDADTRTRLWSVTGTPAGTPLLPAVPTGAIPLAELAIAANATQVTSANITDLRRAAGIRGAVRLMLAGDSHSDPGVLPGEARYCRTHQQIEVWRADGQWHGTQQLQYSTRTVDTSTGTPNISVATISIPDPGWPYRLDVSGSLVWSQGIGTHYDLGLRLDGTLGAVLGQTYGAVNATGALLTDVMRTATGASDATLTGAHVVHMSLVRQSGTNAAFAQTSAAYNLLSCTVIPV
ncbi:hypothetical protein ACVDFE_02080 [Lentzea chajnantorensis]